MVISMDAKTLGERGEELAVQYLKKRGYSVLVRNFRVKFGEIDLVARHKDCICFVEVKTRRSFDVPQEAVSWRKQRTLTRVAQAYLKKNYQSMDVRSRFDVVAIEEHANGKIRIEVIENAFDAV